MQALEVIKLVAGLGTPLIGRLLLFDALAGATREMALTRDPDCPVCGDHPTITTLQDYELFCGMPAREMSRTENLSPAALVARLKEPAPPVLIDVREEWEWTLGHLPDALHVPMGQLPKRLNELPRDRDLVLYCHHGSRSYRAMEFLRQMGFDHVAHLDGGVAAWADEVSEDVGRY